MVNRIVDLYRTNRCVYGVRKLWRAAGRAGLDVGRDQVARYMPHGLNPTVDDSAWVSSTGYTNIENYVNGLFGSPKLEEQSPRTG